MKYFHLYLNKLKREITKVDWGKKMEIEFFNLSLPEKNCVQKINKPHIAIVSTNKCNKKELLISCSHAFKS
jgi:hypothetical protein